MKICYCMLLLASCHSSYATCFRDSLSTDSTKNRTDLNRVLLKPLIIPAGLFATGALSFYPTPLARLDRYVRSEISSNHPVVLAHTDDVLQYLPAIGTFILTISETETRNRIGATAINFTAAEFILASTTGLLRKTTQANNPHRYFPSGHSATAFLGAALLDEEWGNRSAWIGASGYAVAVATVVLRVYNNIHLLSDVVAGAGIGIGAVKLVYGVRKLLSKERGRFSRLQLYPAWSENSTQFTLVFR